MELVSSCPEKQMDGNEKTIRKRTINDRKITELNFFISIPFKIFIILLNEI